MVLLIELPILLLLLAREVVPKASGGRLLGLSWSNRATFFFFMILELSNKSISYLSSLISSLVVLYLSVDHRHVLEISNIVVLNHENSTADFDDVVDFQWVKGTDLSLSTKTEPGSVGGPNVLKIEALSFTLLSSTICDLRMEIAHLRVFLNVECIVHISTNAQS